MVPFIAIFAIFYLLLIRPARVKQKRHQEMLKNLGNGDPALAPKRKRLPRRRGTMYLFMEDILR